MSCSDQAIGRSLRTIGRVMEPEGNTVHPLTRWQGCVAVLSRPRRARAGGAKKKSKKPWRRPLVASEPDHVPAGSVNLSPGVGVGLRFTTGSGPSLRARDPTMSRSLGDAASSRVWRLGAGAPFQGVLSYELHRHPDCVAWGQEIGRVQRDLLLRRHPSAIQVEVACVRPPGRLDGTSVHPLEVPPPFLIGLIEPLPTRSSRRAIHERVKGTLMADHRTARSESTPSMLNGHVFMQRPHAAPFRLPSDTWCTSRRRASRSRSR